MISDFEKEEKLSGGAVFERGVKQSKENKAIRRMAEPLIKKHWKDSVTNLHRIYRVAEYLVKRSKRPKADIEGKNMIRPFTFDEKKILKEGLYNNGH